jgi:hypothetical protein
MAHRARRLGVFLLLLASSVLSADIGGLGSNVTGKWTIKIAGRILGTAELTQSGGQLTGWLEPNGGDRIPLSGALLSGKLTITTHPELRQRAPFDRCTVETGSNHMKGTFYPGNGRIEFMKQVEPRFRSKPLGLH